VRLVSAPSDTVWLGGAGGVERLERRFSTREKGIFDNQEALRPCYSVVTIL
jgi:hypothetical protein